MGRSLKPFGMLKENLVEQADTSYLVGARVIVTFNTSPAPRGCRLEAGDVAAELLQLLGAPNNRSS
jgi:hypothetical protein